MESVGTRVVAWVRTGVGTGAGGTGVGTGTYYRDGDMAILVSWLALAIPGWPPWLTSLNTAAPFQPQDPARLCPTSQRVRVEIHERGGSA